MEEIKKTTIVCRVMPNNPSQIKCDIYSPEGSFLESKVIPKEKLKDLF